MTVGEGGQVWVSGAAARRLGCDTHEVPRLAREGYLAVRRLPGCDPRYLQDDVERLARESTRGARPDALDRARSDPRPRPTRGDGAAAPSGDQQSIDTRPDGQGGEL